VGRKPEANLGTDEQKPDTRPMWWGDPATDGKARQPDRHHGGKSGGVRGKDQYLTLGDLLVPPGNRSRGPETVPDKQGEVSRGRSSLDLQVKG
jgi:hypothetical protein